MEGYGRLKVSAAKLAFRRAWYLYNETSIPTASLIYVDAGGGDDKAEQVADAALLIAEVEDAMSPTAWHYLMRAVIDRLDAKAIAGAEGSDNPKQRAVWVKPTIDAAVEQLTHILHTRQSRHLERRRAFSEQADMVRRQALSAH